MEIERNNFLLSYAAAVKVLKGVKGVNIKDGYMLHPHLEMLYAFFNKFPEIEGCTAYFGDGRTEQFYITLKNGYVLTLCSIGEKGLFIIRGCPAKAVAIMDIPNGAKLAEVI